LFVINGVTGPQHPVSLRWSQRIGGSNRAMSETDCATRQDAAFLHSCL
jgi:hypothetical protein